MRFFLSVLAITIVATACGRQEPQTSRLKLEIGVPAEQVNSQGVTGLLKTLEGINDRATITLAELIAVIPFTEAELAEIGQNRGSTAEVTCANSICTGINIGHTQEIDVSQMNLPGVGRPHISIADRIKLKFRLGSADLLDVCAIEGFSVKKLFLWSEVHAARVRLDASGNAVEASITAAPTTYTRCQ